MKVEPTFSFLCENHRRVDNLGHEMTSADPKLRRNYVVTKDPYFTAPLTALLRKRLRISGAGEGNRTLVCIHPSLAVREP